MGRSIYTACIILAVTAVVIGAGKCEAARHLQQSAYVPGLPPSLPSAKFIPIPGFPIFPGFPGIAFPPLPSIPGFPKIALPPLPSLPGSPGIASPPLPSFPGFPGIASPPPPRQH